VAARRARAAVDNAGNRVPYERESRVAFVRAQLGHVPSRLKRERIYRGPKTWHSNIAGQRTNMIDCRRWLTSLSAGRWTSSRRRRRRPSGKGGQGGDRHDSNCILKQLRPGHGWSGRQSQSTGRQCHGLAPFQLRARAEEARAATGAGSQTRRDRHACKPE
jgi:hypothetical protein